MNDPTFSEQSRFASIAWAAETLGMSKDKFHRRVAKMEGEGFPKRDALTNLYLKADILAWIENRRQVVLQSAQPQRQNGVNFDAL